MLTDLQSRLIHLTHTTTMIPSLIISTLIYNRYSLRTGIIIGCLSVTIGAWLKVFLNIYFNLLSIGQCFCGFGASLILSAVAQFPAVWFEESKRVSAINILWGFYSIGNGFGFIIPVLLVDENARDVENEKVQLFNSYLTQAVITAVFLLITIATFRNEPKDPPSRGALVVRDDDIIGTYRELFTNCEFLKLTANFSILFTVGYTIYLNWFQIGVSYGFNHSDVLFFISSTIGFGCLGIFITGRFLIKYKWYRRLSLFIAFTTFINLVLFLIFYELKNKSALIAIYGSFGFWIYPIYSLWFSYSTDVAFPLKETTFSGIFLLICTFTGTVFANINYLIIDTTKIKL